MYFLPHHNSTYQTIPRFPNDTFSLHKSKHVFMHTQVKEVVNGLLKVKHVLHQGACTAYPNCDSRNLTKGKFVPVQAKTAYSGCRGITPLILNLSI